MEWNWDFRTDAQFLLLAISHLKKKIIVSLKATSSQGHQL